MIIEIGKGNGHIVIDDNTGEIMTVFVTNVIKDKFDFLTTTSYKREGNKHYNIRQHEQ